MIKLPYYFVKKLPLIFFYSSNISSSYLSVLEAFQVPPPPPAFRCREFQVTPSNYPSPSPSRNLGTLPLLLLQADYCFTACHYTHDYMNPACAKLPVPPVCSIPPTPISPPRPCDLQCNAGKMDILELYDSYFCLMKFCPKL